ILRGPLQRPAPAGQRARAGRGGGRHHRAGGVAGYRRALPRAAAPARRVLRTGRLSAMDLGIAGRRAIVCGGSKGLGRAAALALAREGVEVVLIARTADTLKQAAEAIGAETGRTVAFTAADVTTAEGQKAALATCPEADILVTNPGVRQTPAD